LRSASVVDDYASALIKGAGIKGAQQGMQREMPSLENVKISSELYLAAPALSINTSD
jgi:hypothetical protein